MPRRPIAALLVLVVVVVLAIWLGRAPEPEPVPLQAVTVSAVAPVPDPFRVPPSPRVASPATVEEELLEEEEPEPHPDEVRCPVRMDDPVEGPVELVLELTPTDPGSTRLAGVYAEIHEGHLVFQDVPSSLRLGQLTVPGYLRTAFSWTKTGCASISLRQGAVIVGTVRPPSKGVSVRGCGGVTTAADDGSFYLEGAPGPCELEAWRTDGWYSVRSAPVSVHPRLGEETFVELSLPRAQQAGMGARVEATDEGMRLTAIRTGSGADLAGLAAGDVVLAVDGVEVAGLEVQQFSELLRGDVGSEVVLEVLIDGERQQHRLTRQFVSDERVPVEVDGHVEMRPDLDAWVR
jgi:hypothetical protein